MRWWWCRSCKCVCDGHIGPFAGGDETEASPGLAGEARRSGGGGGVVFAGHR